MLTGIKILPGLSTFLYMVAVNRVGGADACVVLRCQVEIFEALQKDVEMAYNIKCQTPLQLQSANVMRNMSAVTL